LAQEVDRLEARAVFVLASGSLARETDYVDRLRQMLGNRCRRFPSVRIRPG
jgi:maleylacetate reductase